MHIFRTLSLSLAALLLTTCSEFDPNNQPASLSEASIAPAANAVRVTGNDIAGSVTSSNGPEAGVWVIAETRDLETLYSKTVVTDDQGRYLIPDLPEADFELWVRGYGLVDSSRTNAKKFVFCRYSGLSGSNTTPARAKAYSRSPGSTSPALKTILSKHSPESPLTGYR